MIYTVGAMIEYIKKRTPEERMWERINLSEKIQYLVMLPNMINMTEAKECFDRLYLMAQAEEILLKM